VQANQENCNNHIDDNCDGFVDCNDPACLGTCNCRRQWRPSPPVPVAPDDATAALWWIRYVISYPLELAIGFLGGYAA